MASLNCVLFAPTVKAVEGGRQALEVLREEGSKYRLLLVDVLMPDMDGLQLLKIFRQAYSEDMPIISTYILSVVKFRMIAYKFVCNN